MGYKRMEDILLVRDFNARTHSRQCEVNDMEDPHLRGLDEGDL